MIFGLNFREENTMANQFLIRQVYKYADKHSQDPSTKTGASIIEETEHFAKPVYTPISFWANRLKVGIEEKFTLEEISEKLKDSYWKRSVMEHAEAGSIRRAKELGYDTNGKTMIMPWIPCEPCAKLLVDNGISKLVTHEAFINKIPLDWKESTMRGVELLLDNNIQIVTYSGKIGSCCGQFRGEIWKP